MTIFQALGVIKGVVTVEESKVFIEFDGRKYPLVSKPTKLGYKHWCKFKNFLGDTPKVLKIAVYPTVLHLPKKEEPHQIRWTFVAYDSGESNGIFEKYKPNEFRIGGLFQWLPCCKLPVVSVYKNKLPGRYDYYQRLEGSYKVRFPKALHVPVIWRSDTCKPVNQTKEVRPAFIAACATFNPITEAFVVNSGEVIEDVPKKFYVKKKREPQTEIPPPLPEPGLPPFNLNRQKPHTVPEKVSGGSSQQGTECTERIQSLCIMGLGH